ncbi:unnamed protein product [Phaeothamnion confervicola]
MAFVKAVMAACLAGSATAFAPSITPSMGLRSFIVEKIGAQRLPGATRRWAIAVPMDSLRTAPAVPPPQFDIGAEPPFTLKDIRDAIPAKCFKKDAWRSVSYLFRDLAVVAGLAVGAGMLNNPLVWPLYWAAQGTMFWALFVVGHDCGHGSFSNSKRLNDIIGHLCHASILVPYHGWRISHRTHHANHGNIETDESWVPMTKSAVEETDWTGKMARFNPIVMLLAYPFYLFLRTPGESGSHFDPKCDLFVDSEAGDVKTSARWYAGMLAVLAAVGAKFGFLFLAKMYLVPYAINVMWLDLVTYLHHTDPEVPWYRGSAWNYMRGGISTRDRDYGIINNIHHDIGTHVVHHLFPQIPHYNLCEATKAVKPVLGEYYKEPEKSGILPFHLIKQYLKGTQDCIYVPDEGEVVYYQPDDGVLAGKK